MNKKFNVFVIEYGIHFTCETELKKKNSLPLMKVSLLK